MFRRLAASPLLSHCALAVGYFTVSPVHCQAAASSGSEFHSEATGSDSNSGQAAKWRRPSLAQQRARRAHLPPAFDVVHWNDEDMSRGHLLRVLHRDSFVVLDYHRQVKKTGEEGNKAERVVSVMLPAVYTARFLSVLEGRSDKVEVHSRFTNAVFAPKPEAQHVFTLNCTSTKPPQQQQQQGSDNEEKFEWSVEFDPAESLMLHRFLSQALHYNTGFARTSI
ncbi:SUN domain-containing protein 1 [Trypanosoma melophagium]|uniref:SUN domain-containing protein 1 n=1 Tax=Trypanosoma melophagium TaxID=715481 RepID=UPI00351A74E4|nr:SUN domain-containing protein 1 [Trypanosoma melophagium]